MMRVKKEGSEEKEVEAEVVVGVGVVKINKSRIDNLFNSILSRLSSATEWR